MVFNIINILYSIKNMYNGQNIKYLIEKKGIKQADVISRSGIKGPTFFTAIKEGANPTAKFLESVADVLECPIDLFFDRKKDYVANDHIGHSVNGNGNCVSGDITLTECRREIAHLRELLQEKEERLKDKEELIALYRQQLSSKVEQM